MDGLLKSFFEKEKIEYYSALRYSDCKELRPDIIKRRGLVPRSVILYLLPYYSGRTRNISAYSASRDYHIAQREISERIIAGLKELYPNNSFFGFADHSPIDERHAALIAGLGILGDNRLLINKKYGTYVFIAEIISDLDPETLGARDPMPILHCEGCGSCTRACPTKSLSQENECLSSITQRKGELTGREIELMRSARTVWGCDMCQLACPHNREPRLTPIDFFHEDRIDMLTTELIDSMNDDQFAARAFSWRGRKTIKRNLDALEY